MHGVSIFLYTGCTVLLVSLPISIPLAQARSVSHQSFKPIENHYFKHSVYLRA